MRGSDPDAAVYYLARMIDAGESVTFISRRIMICASEDVGNADPQALQVAVAASQAVERIGLPEARIILAQAVTYVAGAPKSNAAYMAVNQALEAVRKRKNGMVPNHLRDASYKGASKLAGESDISMPTIFRDIMSNSSIFRMNYWGPCFMNRQRMDMRKILRNIWTA